MFAINCLTFTCRNRFALGPGTVSTSYFIHHKMALTFHHIWKISLVQFRQLSLIWGFTVKFPDWIHKYIVHIFAYWWLLSLLKYSPAATVQNFTGTHLPKCSPVFILVTLLWISETSEKIIVLLLQFLFLRRAKNYTRSNLANKMDSSTL